MKKYLITIIILIILVLFGIIYSTSDIVGPFYFKDMREPKSSDLGQKGWVPNYLPDCIKDVKITTNVDTNEAEYKFTISQDCR
jgi:hypothetical protein